MPSTPRSVIGDGSEDRSSDMEAKPAVISKREKRRAKETRKKVEEEERRVTAKDMRKSAQKKLTSGDSLAQQDGKLDKRDKLEIVDVTTSQQDGKLEKGRSRGLSAIKNAPLKKGIKNKVLPPAVEDVTDESLSAVLDTVAERRVKMTEKWGNHWSGQLQALHRLSC